MTGDTRGPYRGGRRSGRRSAPPSLQVPPNRLDLLRRRAQVFGDLLRDHARVGQGVGIEQALVLQAKEVERALASGNDTELLGRGTGPEVVPLLPQAPTVSVTLVGDDHALIVPYW